MYIILCIRRVRGLKYIQSCVGMRSGRTHDVNRLTRTIVLLRGKYSNSNGDRAQKTRAVYASTLGSSQVVLT